MNRDKHKKSSKGDYERKGIYADMISKISADMEISVDSKHVARESKMKHRTQVTKKNKNQMVSKLQKMKKVTVKAMKKKTQQGG